MRYLVAVDFCFLDHPSGSARVAWDIAEAVRDQGHQVGLVCFAKEKTPERLSEEQGIQILRVAQPTIPTWHPWRTQTFIEQVTQATQKHFGHQAWDTLHLHSLRTGMGVSRAFQGQVRTLFTLHSLVSQEYLANTQGIGWIKVSMGVPYLFYLEHQLLAQSNAIHVLSSYNKKHVSRQHGMAPKIHVIPYWRQAAFKRQYTQAEARERLGWPQDQPLFFTLRRHIPRTGIADAIEAIAPFVREKQCRFYIAGDGPLRTQHEQQATRLGAQDGIFFLGRIPDETLWLAYQAADLFILPTRSIEGFGLISIEAMSFGCPLLSSDSSAIPEVIRPIQPDFLYPAGDSHALQQKIRLFLSHQLIPPTSEALVDYVERRYGFDVIAPSLFRFVEGR